MKKLLLSAILTCALVGCSYYPTETASTVDDRPTISFKSQHHEAAVYLDGQHVGKVGDYLEAKSALRVLPGTHTIQIMIPGKNPVTQKFYVTGGENKVIVAQ